MVAAQVSKKEQREIERLQDKVRDLNAEVQELRSEIIKKDHDFTEAHQLITKASEMTQKELDSCTLVQKVNLYFDHAIIKQNFNPEATLKDLLKLKAEGWKIGRLDFVRIE